MHAGVFYGASTAWREPKQNVCRRSERPIPFDSRCGRRRKGRGQRGGFDRNARRAITPANFSAPRFSPTTKQLRCLRLAFSDSLHGRQQTIPSRRGLAIPLHSLLFSFFHPVQTPETTVSYYYNRILQLLLLKKAVDAEHRPKDASGSIISCASGGVEPGVENGAGVGFT